MSWLRLPSSPQSPPQRAGYTYLTEVRDSPQEGSVGLVLAEVAQAHLQLAYLGLALGEGGGDGGDGGLVLLDALAELACQHSLLLQLSLQGLDGPDAAVHLAVQHAEDGLQRVDLELHGVQLLRGAAALHTQGGGGGGEGF